MYVQSTFKENTCITKTHMYPHTEHMTSHAALLRRAHIRTYRTRITYQNTHARTPHTIRTQMSAHIAYQNIYLHMHRTRTARTESPRQGSFEPYVHTHKTQISHTRTHMYEHTQHKTSRTESLRQASCEPHARIQRIHISHTTRHMCAHIEHKHHTPSRRGKRATSPTAATNTDPSACP